MRFTIRQLAAVIGITVALVVGAVSYHGIVTEPKWTVSSGTVVGRPVRCGLVACADVRTATGIQRLNVPRRADGQLPPIGTKVQVWTDGHSRTAVTPHGVKPLSTIGNITVALGFAVVLGGMATVVAFVCLDGSRLEYRYVTAKTQVGHV